DQLILTNQDGFLFFDILKELKKSPYRKENYVLTEAGEIEYHEDGKSIGIKGIDISKYNGEIDWEKVAASGVHFAYIRAGIRGYGSGEIVKDETFDDNMEKAAMAGLEVGVYFFTQAINEEEAIEEADFVMECIQDKYVSCPIALDLEYVSGATSTPRATNISQEQHTKNAIAFCERLKEKGYTPIIYGNMRTFLCMLDMTKLEDYQKWYAGYISKDAITPYFPYEFRIWQYKSTGKVDGITGDVDLDIAFY
ncbi:MAG: hypothetical protein K5989_11060, partial [Lachnospiraceae bacterium]|nr:hypothetical protein [Lachnospiraceae bacterium]